MSDKKTFKEIALQSGPDTADKQNGFTGRY